MTMTMTPDQLLSSYDYHLPPELIAQNPAEPRDSSRLLVVDSPNSHNLAIFRDLPTWLESGDLLVFNDTRVIPARLFGRKTTGAPVEILLLEEQDDHRWLSLVKPGKRFKVGSEVKVTDSPASLRVMVRVFSLSSKALAPLRLNCNTKRLQRSLLQSNV